MLPTVDQWNHVNWAILVLHRLGNPARSGRDDLSPDLKSTAKRLSEDLRSWALSVEAAVDGLLDG